MIQKTLKSILISTLFSITIMPLKAQFFSCNDDDCGLLEPAWNIVGSDNSVVCEGAVFQLTGQASLPLDNIDDFHWIVYDSSFNILEEETYTNVNTNFEYSFSIDDTQVENCNSSDEGEIDFQVNLIVTSPECGDGESCRNALLPLTVLLKPRAKFEAEDEICETGTISFTNNSCFAENYLWDFGDGQTSTDANPSHSFTLPAGVGQFDYNVCLTAINECGNSEETCHTITVVAYPEAAFVNSTAADIACKDDIIEFDNNSSYPAGNTYWEVEPNSLSGGLNWQFVYDNGIFDSIMTFNSTNLQIQFYQAGEYAVTVFAENICGEEAYETIK